MGWGEPHQPTGPVAYHGAVRRLAEAVRRWNANRIVLNEEAMVDALEEYDRAMQRVDI